MIDPRIAWFAIGVTSGIFLCGWPCHPRFSRFTCHENRKRPSGPAPLKLRRSGEGGPGPSTPKPDIVPNGQSRRVYHYNPATIAECGGPCEEGRPAACDCGAITWTDRPVKPEFPPPRKIGPFP